MKSYTLYDYDTSTFGFKELVCEMMDVDDAISDAPCDDE